LRADWFKLSPQGPAHADIYGGLVSEGIVSRTVRDSAAALDAIYGSDAGAPYSAPVHTGRFLAALDRPPARMRVGINRQCPDDVSLSADALAALDQAARSLESLGHHVLPVDLTV
jgi:amidase